MYIKHSTQHKYMWNILKYTWNIFQGKSYDRSQKSLSKALKVEIMQSIFFLIKNIGKLEVNSKWSWKIHKCVELTHSKQAVGKEEIKRDFENILR